MPGYLLLAGGSEFGGAMSQVDKRALELAGGPAVPVCIIPTAAAGDNNHLRAGANGSRWFQSLGARHVSVPLLIDAASANDAALAAQLRQARLIYLLGGWPGYLGETLQKSLCWQAMLEAYDSGAVLAGSSAGAMVLCQYYYDPSQHQVKEGLNLLSNVCVLPHHNTFGQAWAAQLFKLLPDAVLLGIDEYTGLIDDRAAARKTSWQVYGSGSVTLYRQGQPVIYHAGQHFEDPFLSARREI